MAAEFRDESPAPAAAPPLPVREKRAGSEDGGEEEKEELPEPKRRRACVAALDSVPSAVPADGEGEGEGDEHRDGASFSFKHAPGGFVALETTPKFGSFNPPVEAATEPKPAPSAGEDSPKVEEEEDAASDRSGGEDEGGNSLFVLGLGVQGLT